MSDQDWFGHKRELRRYQCACGSGGPLSCEADCPGDLRDSSVKDALIAVIEGVEALEHQLAQLTENRGNTPLNGRCPSCETLKSELQILSSAVEGALRRAERAEGTREAE